MVVPVVVLGVSAPLRRNYVRWVVLGVVPVVVPVVVLGRGVHLLWYITRS
jgi:hypothetical protein